MKREKFLGVSYFKKDGRAIKKGDDGSDMPLKEMRKSVLNTMAEKDLKLSNYKFQKFLNDKGMFKESREAKKININDIKVKNKKIVNEVKFASGSFLEGFLSFYGIQLDKAIKKYENRLHIIEEDDSAYIGKINREGGIKRVSPKMDKEKAKEKLKEFEKQRELKKKRELDRAPEIKLERKNEEER